MPVSYLSKEIQTSPYVLPVDLELLAKVNSYKQGMFYQNAQKVSDQLGQLGNLDIANATQKQYLTNSINNVTQKINDYGGIDYSDMNISNSIENLGNEVAKDENVINAVASTRQVRNIQNNYQKMANDPKLSKFYSQAYETYDYEHFIKPYISSSNLKASYDGPANPTLYTGNPLEKAAKLIKQANPEITAEIVNGKATGGYINVVTKQRYTPETLAASFDSVIDGQTKTELLKNAWYTLDYSARDEQGNPPEVEQYIKMQNDQSQHDYDVLDATIKAKKQAYLDSGLEGDAKIALAKEIKDAEQAFTNFGEARTANEQAFRDEYKRDKESALFQLYVGGMKQDLYKIFGATKTTIAMKDDLNQAAYNAKEIAFIRQGKRLIGINPDGSYATEDIAGTSATQPSSIGSNITLMSDKTEEEKLKENTVYSIETENQKHNSDLSKSFIAYIGEEASKDTDLASALGIVKSITNDPNSAGYVFSSDKLNIISNLSQDSGKNTLDINDLRAVTSDKATGAKYGLNTKAYDYLNTLVQSYDKLIKDPTKDVSVSESFKGFMGQYEDKMSLINANKKLLEDTKNAVIDAGTVKLTAEERAKVKEYYNNPSLHSVVTNSGVSYQSALSGRNVVTYANGLGATPNIVTRPNDELTAILKRTNFANSTDINAAINKQLQHNSYRLNYNEISLKDDLGSKKAEANISDLTNYITTNNKPYLEGKKISLNKDNVKPLSVYYSPDGWKLTYALNIDGKQEFSSSAADAPLKDVIVSSETANALGTGSLPYPDFERAATIQREGIKTAIIGGFKNINPTNNMASENTPPISIRVHTPTNSLNNAKWSAQIYSPSLGKYIELPFSKPEDEAMYSKTANGAYWYATQKLQSYINTNNNRFGQATADNKVVKTADTFIDNIINGKYNDK